MIDSKYWLGFSLIPRIGLKRLIQLRDAYDDLEAAWTGRIRVPDWNDQLIQHVTYERDKIDISLELEKVERAGAWVLTYLDARYPAMLKELDDAPAVLYIRGRLVEDESSALSVVGTRKATKYGQDVAMDLSRQLASHRVTIVSGMAHGIDAAAHQGALKAHGKTYAVLGCGVDVVYPREHLDLMKAISHNGAIISEFRMGSQPVAANFPRRNRILSGLSHGVLVVEAPEHSGALITATLAAEQGRDVFAVPANIYNPMGRGTNRLIQDGAKLVTDVADILEELNVTVESRQVRVRTEQVRPSNDTEALILKYLGADPIHIDELVRASGLPTSEVSSTLTILELKGVAQLVGNMQYSLVSTR